jgi:TonB-dependent Receptor Plug Domain/Carboxypeptidase regulatory-like domain
MARLQLNQLVAAMFVAWLTPSAALGQTLSGTLRDETGGALPGVSVELRTSGAATRMTVSDPHGVYTFDAVRPGQAQIAFTLINFATARREQTIPESGEVRVDAVLRLALNADVVVTGRSSFANLADVASPAENLVGIAQSASQGAVTAAQLDARPMLRAGEVLETVPGVMISQHSGEGKANQYYLRGFNLDHGTDFSTTLAGMPVNMPTHAHGHGYSDLNFMIPELVSGVQFSKGPYFAEQGDFATAGAANINYVTALDRPIARVGGGGEGFRRVFAAASPALGRGRLLTAFETQHNDGPWENPDDYRKVNGIVRYSRGDSVNGIAVTGMAYRGTWNSTDQVPQRAIDGGLIGRFGAIDASDGGDTYRYSGSVEWQQTRGSAVTKIAAYGIGYDLNLFSNVTFFLDDPAAGDQLQQADHRFVTGGKATYRRLGQWLDRETQNSIGVQLRNDNITNVALYHSAQRQRLGTTRQDAVLQTSVAGFAQNETVWTPRLRTTASIRVDGYHFDVDSIDPVNSGTGFAGLTSPKGGVVIGPFRGTELYANGGLGYHSNDARGATITRDPATGEPAGRATPLARATGAEAGVRTVAIPHLQSSLAVWSLGSNRS